MQGDRDDCRSWRERSIARFAGLFAWTMIAGGLFALGSAEGTRRLWLASGTIVAGLVVLLLRALKIDARMLGAAIIIAGMAASMGSYAWIGFLSGSGVAMATTVMLTGLLFGPRVLVAVLVLQAVCVSAIAFLVTHGHLAAPDLDGLDPMSSSVWLRTMSVSFLLLVLFSSALVQITGHMDRSIERAEAETVRRERAERMRAELERKATETRHLETIGRLASGVAHDFNNNLTAIIGMSELLKSELDKGSMHREMVQQILDASLRSAELARQLLAYSRKARVQPTPTQIEDVVSSSVSLVRRSMNPNIQVTLELGANGATVSADPALLQSAIMNLLLNARDAMLEGGRLTIRTRVDHVRPEGRDAPPENDHGWVELTIRDTGHGMDREVLSRAFDPFFTTKAPGEGTGLGLSAVSGTVESHGGHIEVESTPGAGTTFRVKLPLIDSETEAVASEPTLKRGSAEILLVDDEPTVRHTAGALLASLGHHVTLAEDGDHAIRMAQDAVSPFELIVLDSKMPGLSREETFRALRESVPGVPVLFWSGRAGDETLDKLLTEPDTDFIQKPYRASELADRVLRLTSRHGKSESLRSTS
jgi:signal transduction histidine kinase/CheY-like chemotaxis protein